MQDKNLYEILVPAYISPENSTPYDFHVDRRIPQQHHRIWDEQVRKISGGMTIFKSGIGEWEGTRERMIPVRFLATREEALELAKFTKEHYKQKAVMLYKLSDDVIIYE